MNAHFGLTLVATICWAIAAVGLPPAYARWGIGWLGLMFFGLSLLFK